MAERQRQLHLSSPLLPWLFLSLSTPAIHFLQFLSANENTHTHTHILERNLSHISMFTYTHTLRKKVQKLSLVRKECVTISAFDAESICHNLLDIGYFSDGKTVLHVRNMASNDKLLSNNTGSIRILTDDKYLTEHPSSVNQCSWL